jgi:hypothetical protein
MATVAECSAHCCVSMTRLRDLIAAGIIKHQASGQYSLDEVRESYIKNLQAVASNRGGDYGKLSKQRAKLEEAKTEAVLHKNAINRGDYVSLKVVRKVGEAMMGAFRERCLSIPGSTADALTPLSAKDRAEIEEILREKIYDALLELSSPDFPGWGPMTGEVEEAA